MQTHLTDLLQGFTQAVQQGSLIRMILSNRRDKQADLRQVQLKPVKIKNKAMIGFVYRYSRRDITKNFDLPSASLLIEELLNDIFLQAEMQCVDGQWNYGSKGKGSSFLTKKQSSESLPAPEQNHDRIKHRKWQPESGVLLEELGISNAQGQVKPSMQYKFKQIHAYIELLEKRLNEFPRDQVLNIVDMGCGKAYLTFALSDFLRQKKQAFKMIGVEQRPELVENANRLARKCQFSELQFVEGNIQEVELGTTDVLIALHACDTATDDAIYKGIAAGASLIVCAPCCHKQIRKNMEIPESWKAISRFGIIKERQAELLTDLIRSALLETMGYHTLISEFIDLEHTHKNLMLMAWKIPDFHGNKARWQEVQTLKTDFGIRSHYLEEALIEGGYLSQPQEDPTRVLNG